MKTQTTKSSLLTSVLALFLCISMLLGTTFAWFTDSVTSAGNKIVSGSLKVDLELLDETTNKWNSLKKDETPLYNNTLWEPGYTEVKILKVENEGTLALKWQAVFVAQTGLSELADVIDVYVLPYGVLSADEAAAQVAYPADRGLDGYTRVGTLAEFVSDISATTYGNLAAGESAYLGIALRMQPTAGNKYQNMDLGVFDIKIVATQATSENDSFGNDYDNGALFPEMDLQGGITADVTTDADNKVANDTVISKNDGTVNATVPAGVQLDSGVNKLTLTVTEMNNTGTNLQLKEDEELRSLDVHVSGVSKNNTVPITVHIPAAMVKGLNLGNYTLIHVQDGVSYTMTGVSTKAELTSHNQFYYDPATGDVYLSMATFSEVALVAEPAKWEGDYDDSWYNTTDKELYIANSDQLAAFGAIVGGMLGYTADTFEGKTVKLVANIVIGDIEKDGDDPSENGYMFYPIGYYNNTESYEHVSGNVGGENKNEAIVSGFRNFSGIFDGNGHTISDWYQNTWEAFGDYNDGYSGTPNYNRDGFGLFGKVYKGTVKNLTVKNFSSDGEFATTGSIAAYAEGATFENIAIFNCNPRVYNIGNGGIVGCVGWYAKEENLKTIFKNITVDNTNKISALWGSWDVACGGILGQYYPTSGQTSAGKPANGGVEMINCHVAAQIDVYNDVCANYQYYAYRYAGMLIGSVRENVVKDGHEYPKMDGITFSGCTVHYGDWNDYYYCELVANTTASYTHDYQMSRLEQVASVDVNNKKVTYLDGTTADITGTKNFVVVKAKDTNGKWIHGDGEKFATCYHFVNGEVWSHEDGGYHDGKDGGKIIDENNDGQPDLREDKQLVYREFDQLVTGYGWGVTSQGIVEGIGVTILDREEAGSVIKFTGTFIPEIESYTEIKLSELFSFANNGVELNLAGLSVTVTDLDDADGIATGTFKLGSTWEESTITVNGKGKIAITIQDYYFCTPYTVTLTAYDPMTSLDIDFTKLYNVNQTLNINSITVNYKSGKSKVLSADEYELSMYDMSFAGKKTITVTYTEYEHTITQNFTITVSDTFNSLTVTPDKEIYNVGDKVNFTVYAVASDGTREEVTGATVTGADTSTAGIKTVTITFGNKSTTCEIVVLKNVNLDSANANKGQHALFWFYNHQFMLGGVASSSTNNYNDYIDNVYHGNNGEIAIGFNNQFGGEYTYEGSPNGGNALILGAEQYGLTIVDALPYTYLGIRCIAGYDAKLLGFGYYIDGNASTLKYSAPMYYSDKVLTDPGYQTFIDRGGQYTAEANTTVCLNDLGFAAGSNHTITWVAVFEDGYQTISDWKVSMKSTFGSDEFFKDSADKPNVNVIVLAGQSNAAGVAPVTLDMQIKYNSVNYKNIFMQYKNVWLETGNIDQNEKFETYYYGMGGAYENFFGPDAALAYYLATTPGLKDEQWFIIKYTAPGTGLEIHWLNNNNLANDMMGYVEHCISGLTDQYDVQLHSLLWMQGENDALVEDIAGRYAINEQTLVTMFRNKFAKYATLPNDQIPGSGISFISAGIAPAGKDGNTWKFATAVNNAKRDNAYIWYAPGSIGDQSALFDYISYFDDNNVGGKSGSIINPNENYGIYNSVYIDTSLMSAKVDDSAHYDAQSMEWLGTWFAQYVQHMIDANLPAPPPSQSNTNTIYLNANGGVISLDRLDVTIGDTITLPIPTRDGYYFVGWYDIFGNKIDASYTPTETVLLTAKWGNRKITIENNISGVIVSGVENNQIINAGEIINVTVTNNNARPIVFDLYDSTNNVLLYREVVVSGATSVTVPYAMGTNVSVVITNDAYVINVQNNVNGVTTNVVSGAAYSGQTLSAEFVNKSGKAVYIYYYNTTGGTLINRFKVEDGETLPVGYLMNNDLKIVISEIYNISYSTNSVNSVKIKSVDKTEAEQGETVTITLSNSSNSSKTVTVKFGNESKKVSVSRNSSATVTFEMPAEDVTVTIS